MATRFGNNSYGGNKGRWGYGGGFKGRENTGPRSHQRFGGGNQRSQSNGYHNGGCKLHIFKSNFQPSNCAFCLDLQRTKESQLHIQSLFSVHSILFGYIPPPIEKEADVQLFIFTCQFVIS